MKQDLLLAIAATVVLSGGLLWFLAPTKKPATHEHTAKTATKVNKLSLHRGVNLGRSTERLAPAPTGSFPAGDRVVFVTWHATRADHVHAYGYPRPTTPTLDTLSSEGLRFTSFISAQASIVPAHVSIFSGVHPDEYGVVRNTKGGQFPFRPHADLPLLAQHLDANGYLTAGFVSTGTLKKSSGITAGFQEWSEPRRRSRPARATTRTAIRWIEKAPDDRPFFLWVSVADTQAPYRPLDSHSSFFSDINMNDWMTDRGILPSPLGEKVVHWTDGYDRELRQQDDALGELLAALKKRGWADAVVVVAGDHGEGLGQHGEKLHGTVWPEQLRAPLVIRAPGQTPREIAEPTTTADILPTLAAVADLPQEETLLKNRSGRDATTAPSSPVAVVSRTTPTLLRATKRREAIPELPWSLTTNEWYLRDTPSEALLFKLPEDVAAKTNVASANPEVVKTLQKQLHDAQRRYHKRAEALGRTNTFLTAQQASDL